MKIEYCDACDTAFPKDELYPIGKWSRLCEDCLRIYFQYEREDALDKALYDDE